MGADILAGGHGEVHAGGHGVEGAALEVAVALEGEGAEILAAEGQIEGVGGVGGQEGDVARPVVDLAGEGAEGAAEAVDVQWEVETGVGGLAGGLGPDEAHARSRAAERGREAGEGGGQRQVAGVLGVDPDLVVGRDARGAEGDLQGVVVGGGEGVEVREDLGEFGRVVAVVRARAGVDGEAAAEVGRGDGEEQVGDGGGAGNGLEAPGRRIVGAVAEGGLPVPGAETDGVRSAVQEREVDHVVLAAGVGGGAVSQDEATERGGVGVGAGGGSRSCGARGGRRRRQLPGVGAEGVGIRVRGVLGDADGVEADGHVGGEVVAGQPAGGEGGGARRGEDASAVEEETRLASLHLDQRRVPVAVVEEALLACGGRGRRGLAETGARLVDGQHDFLRLLQVAEIELQFEGVRRVAAAEIEGEGEGVAFRGRRVVDGEGRFARVAARLREREGFERGG